MRPRCYVLAEPYGPNDFTICRTVGDATRRIEQLAASGISSRLVETTGTANDIRTTLRRLRAEVRAVQQDRLTSSDLKGGLS